VELKGTNNGKIIISISFMILEKLNFLSQKISPMQLQIQIENLGGPRLAKKVHESIL
jgi:hypothetical protein